MKQNRLLHIMGEIDGKHIEDAALVEKPKKRDASWIKWGALAACLALLISAGAGSFALVAEAKEYEAALSFFREHEMPTDGLTRTDIKAVYKDITTASFSYSKTAEVIQNSISSEYISGYEIIPGEYTPKEVEELWNLKSSIKEFPLAVKKGINYEFRQEFESGLPITFKASHITMYNDSEQVWSLSFPEFEVRSAKKVSDGVIAYGPCTGNGTTVKEGSWLVKIRTDGTVAWSLPLEESAHYRDGISAVVENADGSYTIFSQGNACYLRLSIYSAEGTYLGSHHSDINYFNTVSHAAVVDDGYFIRTQRSRADGEDRIVKLGKEGQVLGIFLCESEDAVYKVTDMIGFNGRLYLSAYAIPKVAAEGEGSHGGYEAWPIVQRLQDYEYGGMYITGAELTPMVREQYTAVLLVCDLNELVAREFYSVEGGLGAALSVNEDGLLLWEVDSITDTFYSPATSSFTIGGATEGYRYAFGSGGVLVGQERTGEVGIFRR